jgi:methionyl aminopeptidase
MTEYITVSQDDRIEARSGVIKLHGPDGFLGMRAAGRLAAEILDALVPHVVPGATTAELDRRVYDHMLREGALPATLGYRGYTKSCCISINHVVCHGIPGDKALKDGDIVNIDITVIKDGWHGDTSRMFYLGEPTVQARRLCETTYECLWKGIEMVRPGAALGDIGSAIQRHAESKGFSVVREFCGHGIGKRFHEEPQILHYGRPGQGMKLVEGMTFTIEPMINAGKRDIRQLGDGWTIVTADHTLSAQWEHTVLVTAEGYEILTRSAGTPPPPAFVSEGSKHLTV